MQAVQDDGIELQPLGFVHGHDFDRALLAGGLRRGEQARHRGVQQAGVQSAVRRQPLDQLEQAFGIAGRAGSRIQARPAQAPPQLLQPGGQRQQAGVIGAIQQDRRHGAQAPVFVGRQRLLGQTARRRRIEQAALPALGARRAAQRAFEQRGHRRQLIGAEQALQRSQGQAAPWRAQHRQPGQPVARMRQRARQLHQIGHHGAQPQRHQLDGAAGNSFLRQAARQAAQVAAGAHQDRDGMAAAFVLGQRRAHQADRDVLGLPLGAGGVAAFPGGVEQHRLARRRLVERGRGAVGNGAGIRVIGARQQLREHAVDPIHHAALRTEVVGQLQEARPDLAHAPLGHLQEQADLGLAETVDGLHRVAHQEQRAAIAVLPAGGQRGQQVDLALAGVLEFVDQQMADRRVQRAAIRRDRRRCPARRPRAGRSR